MIIAIMDGSNKPNMIAIVVILIMQIVVLDFLVVCAN